MTVFGASAGKTTMLGGGSNFALNGGNGLDGEVSFGMFWAMVGASAGEATMLGSGSNFATAGNGG